MNPIDPDAAKGTPVGAKTGAVHLLQWTFLDKLNIRVQAMCGKVPRGNMVDRTGEEPTCQGCIDERDYRAAQDAGFEHLVHASRVPLGHSPVAGNNAMRYGSKVSCSSHRTPNDRATVIWSTNNPGKLREAEKIARQHYVEAYRESLTAKTPETEA
jgi:hypothetical protein